VDVIDGVPAEDQAHLRTNPRVTLYQKTSSRVMFVAFDTFAEPTPGVADTGGRNPLKDPRVRKALSLAINRDAIVDRVTEGTSVAIGELVHPGAFGSNRELRPDPYDPQQARALLAEAGYPDGFSITLGAPNDGVEKASQISQAIAAMWTRIGVKTRVDGWTLTTFFGLRNKYQFSAYLSAAQSYTGEAAFLLKALVATPDAQTGSGVINKGRYSNPRVDAILGDALRTLDDTARAALLGKASSIAMADHGVVPLHAVIATWAVRKGLRYTPYTDTGTYAMAVRPDSAQ
jgi:peptide/nickel transport system substrate-binding protein